MGETEQKHAQQDTMLSELKNLPISVLSGYALGFNIFLSNGEKQGILINFMDLEPSPQNVKVLLNGEFEYWTEDESQVVKVEKRNWIKN